MNIKFAFYILLLTKICQSTEIFTCKSVGGSILDYDIYKDKFNSEISKDKDSQVVFVLTKNGGSIKGNAGQSDLKKITDTQFLEPVPAGHVIIWTLLRLTKENKTILIQHKAYQMVGAASFTTMYDCK